MDLQRLPFYSPLELYQKHADELFDAFPSGDPQAIRMVHRNHPRFLDEFIPWLPRDMTDAEIQAAPFGPGDAQLTIARWHCFLNWSSLGRFVKVVTQGGSVGFRFESAVEAVITGDLPALRDLLARHPHLARTRSARCTPFDPPEHRATLLHYVAANGVEGYRQKCPPNAVEIARTLLEAGAPVNALADMYGGKYNAMSMLVSSSPPAAAGVQVPLIELFLDYGAAIRGRGSPKWRSPLMTALAFGFVDAAQALVRRGAPINHIAAAAGLGLVEKAARLLRSSTPQGRHRALALAAQHGHVEIVRLLLDAGEDSNRYNPESNHPHTTPLHQAVLGGHEAVVRLLVERGARLDLADRIYRGTPLNWARHAGHSAIGNYLLTHGAKAASPSSRADALRSDR